MYYLRARHRDYDCYSYSGSPRRRYPYSLLSLGHPSTMEGIRCSTPLWKAEPAKRTGKCRSELVPNCPRNRTNKWSGIRISLHRSDSSQFGGFASLKSTRKKAFPQMVLWHPVTIVCWGTERTAVLANRRARQRTHAFEGTVCARGRSTTVKPTRCPGILMTAQARASWTTTSCVGEGGVTTQNA